MPLPESCIKQINNSIGYQLEPEVLLGIDNLCELVGLTKAEKRALIDLVCKVYPTVLVLPEAPTILLPLAITYRLQQEKETINDTIVRLHGLFSTKEESLQTLFKTYQTELETFVHNLNNVNNNFLTTYYGLQERVNAIAETNATIISRLNRLDALEAAIVTQVEKGLEPGINKLITITKERRPYLLGWQQKWMLFSAGFISSFLLVLLIVLSLPQLFNNTTNYEQKINTSNQFYPRH